MNYMNIHISKHRFWIISSDHSICSRFKFIQIRCSVWKRGSLHGRM